mgnify:CR=1 FL=1
MENCIESLLVGGEEVEILIVDDGSSDRTAEIADDDARKYPTIVKAIHQENGKTKRLPDIPGASYNKIWILNENFVFPSWQNHKEYYIIPGIE